MDIKVEPIIHNGIDYDNTFMQFRITVTYEGKRYKQLVNVPTNAMVKAFTEEIGLLTRHIWELEGKMELLESEND